MMRLGIMTVAITVGVVLLWCSNNTCQVDPNWPIFVIIGAAGGGWAVLQIIANWADNKGERHEH